MAPLNVGLIGYGVATQRFHLPFILPNPDLNVYAFLQRAEAPPPGSSVEKGKHCTVDYPKAKHYRTSEDFFADASIDLVIVCTGHDTHTEFAEKALLAGKHVVVEKPFTPSAAEADHLIALAKEKGKLLTVFQNRRYDSGFRTLYGLTQKGVFGQLTDVTIHYDVDFPAWIANWKGGEYKPGDGIMFGLGSHSVDQALLLIGATPTSVTGFNRTLRDSDSEVEDTFIIILQFGGELKKLLATIRTTPVTPMEHPLKYLVRGYDGSFIKFGEDNQEPQIIAGMQSTDEGFGVEDPVLHGKLVTKTQVDQCQTFDSQTGRYVGIYPSLVGSHRKYYEDVVEAIKTGKEPPVKAQQSRDGIRVIELARQERGERNHGIFGFIGGHRCSVLCGHSQFVLRNTLAVCPSAMLFDLRGTTSTPTLPPKQTAQFASALYVPLVDTTSISLFSASYTALASTSVTSGNDTHAEPTSTYERAAATNTAEPPPNSVPVLPGEAWDCLYSVPLDVEMTLEFIRGVTKYLQFQSTLKYLADPPAESLQDPVDIIGSLEQLADQVRSGQMAHHILFEEAVTKLLQRCHESHLAVLWNSARLISFLGPFPLVSLSVDGISKPKAYVLGDLQEIGFENSSYITRIDGQEIEAYLAEFSNYGRLQSPDARYNGVFARLDVEPPYPGTFLSLNSWYPGKNSISITFSNLSTYEYNYQAIASWDPTLNWTGINNGPDFYHKVVLNQDFLDSRSNSSEKLPTATTTLTSSSTTAASMETGLPPLVIFNQPFMRITVPAYVQDLNAIFARDLSAPHQHLGFQAALREFLAEARRQQSQKLIIDVRGNGGGIVNIGFELYKQLFPAAHAHSYSRLRSHPAAHIYAKTAEMVTTDESLATYIRLSRSTNVTEEQVVESGLDLLTYSALANGISGGFNRQVVLDLRGNKPRDLATFMGPYTVPSVNDTVSLLVENNLDLMDGDAEITGFGSLANLTSSPQPFRKEDILLVSDGVCASTCTIFAELLKREQAHISTVVMGGRPNDAPSPHIGGTHGSRAFKFSDLLQGTALAVDLLFSNSSQQEQQNITDTTLPSILPFSLVDASVNTLDAIRPEDKTQTPLQFKLEPADCRLYNTPDSQDAIFLWRNLAELKWGTKSNFTRCAVGGFQGSREALPGNRTNENEPQNSGGSSEPDTKRTLGIMISRSSTVLMSL
ncbi:hypothetical protein Dda_7881 [Drechslerella dactyloides]|uniref:Uncharacterized protein n=1 Tax=Drechslerella dactyloides TaxID=74499 RepID=A0AAD6IR12_DREDA|nr:hypothetical protein Dda_7881 [Drechslerella dactyloides]